MTELGASYEVQGMNVLARGCPELKQPTADLDCGNSGTTMRLLSGIVSSRPIQVRLTGDHSLQRRPMNRVAQPLQLMGAGVTGERPPLTIQGKDKLRGIRYVSPVASAQVKSATLLAGLKADGPTRVDEPALSRDHTERFLRGLGVSVTQGQLENGGSFSEVMPFGTWDGFKIDIPADISSAAFWMVAAAIVPNSRIRLVDVGVNPSRTGVLDVFQQAGLDVRLENERMAVGEPVADIIVSHSDGTGFQISGGLVPRLIDEIPVLAILATQLQGESVIRDAEELKVKESNRLERIAEGIRAMGGEVEVLDDGLIIPGQQTLTGARIDCNGDHRIGMTFAIAGLVATSEVEIIGAQTISTSYPGFEEELRRVTNNGG